MTRTLVLFAVAGVCALTSTVADAKPRRAPPGATAPRAPARPGRPSRPAPPTPPDAPLAPDAPEPPDAPPPPDGPAPPHAPDAPPPPPMHERGHDWGQMHGWFEGVPAPGAHHFAFAFGRGRLGVSVSSMTEPLRRHFGGNGKAGILVQSVEDGTPADKAGIEVGDMIVAVDGEAIDDVEDVAQAIADRGAGDKVEVEVVRGKKTRRLSAELNDDGASQWRRELELRDLPGGVHIFGDDALGERLDALEQRLDALERELGGKPAPRAKPGRTPARRGGRRVPADRT